jgi:hypothetical protein
MAKKKNPFSPQMRAQFAETMRMLQERAAYHGRKADEEERRKGAQA